MSEDRSGRGADRPDGDDARPTTAAGRRRRAGDGGDTSSGSSVATKGSPTPSRDGRPSGSEGNVLQRLRRFLREVVAELRKVHWPTRRQIVVYTVVVLVFVAFMVTLVGLLDVGFQKLTFTLFG
ncbi:preprotein translocase subunit SecE [Actinomycetospora termitidis]|uniref:Protein translocase subunit SecE n=1 Tax=Actinomycetospora termitidis TaxID=3053470 RepID=A0ABT7M403_9PSEU|nr:preprotein translocase subunit SecE [Actinomycetospora sp. Odt1-22]MDL5155410.1 preprotein translocase subunit SecE [Actinomycetospora sp. Odt1-22]